MTIDGLGVESRVDWELPEQVWRLAGRAFQAYAERRRKQRDTGAPHSSGLHYGRSRSRERLPPLTLDDRLYRSSFPTLAIETF